MADVVLKASLVYALSDLMPILILIALLKYKVLPRNFGLLGIIALFFIDNRVQNYFNYGRNVNRIANYIAIITFAVFLYLLRKYKWLVPKQKDE